MIIVDFDFKKFVSELSPDELYEFSMKSGTTVRYIKSQLIYRTKIPRPELIDSLVVASNGCFNKTQLVDWLYDLKRA